MIFNKKTKSKTKKGKFYINHAVGNHPSLTIDYSNEDWLNRPITHSKIKGYEKLHKNPNKNDSKDAYISRRVRVSKLTSRGKELKKFRLSFKDRKYKKRNGTSTHK